MDTGTATALDDSRLDHGLILLANDEAHSSEFAEATLRLEGYDVVRTDSGADTLRRVVEVAPDLVLVDMDLGDLDGIEICRRLRSDPATEQVLIVVLVSAALMQRRVAALDAGADDFIMLPFDQTELLARVRATLRRSRLLRDANPLTGMPGNVRVRKELSVRIGRGAPFAMLHVDLDNFKAFNDRYGFSRGDEALRVIGDIVRTCARTHGGPESFVGHLGGDDFVIVVDPGESRAVAQAVIGAWDERVRYLYDERDYELGYIEVADRRRITRRFPIAAVSIGIATNERRTFASPVEVAEVASSMKMVAKREGGSTFAVDRRTEDEVATA